MKNSQNTPKFAKFNLYGPIGLNVPVSDDSIKSEILPKFVKQVLLRHLGKSIWMDRKARKVKLTSTNRKGVFVIKGEHQKYVLHLIKEKTFKDGE